MCYVAANMREADRREITAVADLPSLTAAGAAMFQMSPRWRFVAHEDVDDGTQPIAAFGVATDDIAPHLGVGWAYGTRRIIRAVPEIARFALDALRPALIRAGLRRVEVRTIISHDISHRWLEGMGARREGEARSYGRDGSDFAVYAWTGDE